MVGLGVDADPELGEVRADDFVGDLGPADVRAEVTDFGNAAQLFADVDRDPPHGFERGAGLLDPVHQEVVFLKVGKELFAQADRRPSPSPQRPRPAARRPSRAVAPGGARPPDRCALRIRTSGDSRRRSDGTRQEQQREGRRDRERHQERGQDGQHIGQRERAEERAGKPFQEEDRHEHQDHDQAGVNDSASDFERGVEHDPKSRARVGERAIESQPAHDVLDVDDRVVNHLAHRDHQARDDHRVERRTHGRQDQCRGDQRQRNRRQADHGRAPVKEKRQQDDDHQHAADDHRLGEIFQRPLDERRRAEDGRVDVDPLQPGLQVFDRFFDLLGDFERIAGRLFFDDQQQSFAVVDHGIADRRRKADLDLGDIAQPQRSTVAKGDGGLGEVFGLFDGREVADGDSLIGHVDEAAAGDGRRVGDRLDHRVERHAVQAAAGRDRP